MKNLLKFLHKFAHVLFFVVLQTICVILLVSFNSYHQAAFLNSSNKITGSVLSKWNDLNTYFNLKKQNELLLEENENLRNMLELSFQDDTPSLDNAEFSYISAKVVRATANHTQNYLTINKGTKNGVSPEMGVISPTGVVGITYVSGEHFSSILPIINTRTGISVKLENKHYFGSLSWNGKNINTAQLNEIPVYVELKIGDNVVTSGFSAFFPEGIPVGKIMNYNKNKATGFYDIEVELANDFNKTYFVYVVNNKHFKERKSIESITYDN